MLEHPSPFAVFPSSHVSGELTIPFPQVVVHVLAVVVLPAVQVYPDIAPMQFDLHPIPSFAFPSSQVSGLTTLPSPQIG